MVLKTVAANNEKQAAEGMGGIIFRTTGIGGTMCNAAGLRICWMWRGCGIFSAFSHCDTEAAYQKIR